MRFKETCSSEGDGDRIKACSLHSHYEQTSISSEKNKKTACVTPQCGNDSKNLTAGELTLKISLFAVGAGSRIRC